MIPSSLIRLVNVIGFSSRVRSVTFNAISLVIAAFIYGMGDVKVMVQFDWMENGQKRTTETSLSSDEPDFSDIISCGNEIWI